MLVFLLAFLPSAAGSAILPFALGDTEGWLWLVLAPIGGFVGGMAAGVVIGRRYLAWLGFFVGVIGCAVAQVIAWLVLPASGDTAALPFFLGWGCVPFVVGCFIGAAAATPRAADHGEVGPLRAFFDFLSFWG